MTTDELFEIVARALPKSHRWEPRLDSAGCNVGGCDLSYEEHTQDAPPSWDEIVAAREALTELGYRWTED